MRVSTRFLVPFLLAAPLSAQQVELQLREEGSRTPVIGAIVRLLPEAADEPVHAQALSNAGGRVSLAAPGPGRYRIRVDRIGWVGLITPPFGLAAEQVLASEIILPDTRMELPTISVQARSVCGPQFEGDLRTAQIWEEIGKALTANVITTEAGTLPLRLREFRRELHTNGTVTGEWSTGASIVHGKVYQTLPPEFLAQEGFVLEDTREATTIYAVPDAELLISPEFTLTHCFLTVTGEDGLVGLYFEPVPRRPVSDIKGTIWLDPATSELKYLEYTYTGLPPLPSRVELGGRVDFTRLPTGEWIVSHWYVRTPWINVVEMRARRNTYREVERMHGFIELGGRVDVAPDPEADLTLSVVVGRVTDSLTGRGLEGAMITVAGLGAVLTDEEGRYSIAVSAAGPQEVTASHPMLALLGRPTVARGILSVGDEVTVNFSTPSLETLVRAACGNVRNRSGLVGVVVDARGQVQPGLDVRARWPDQRGGTREQRARMNNRTGLFGFCDLPGDDEVELVVTSRQGPLTTEVIEVPFREFTWATVRVP